ncbi:glycosyltransferase [Aequorivita viscosa]|nr:glycosyltransferase [Aequorivita viscosa]
MKNKSPLISVYITNYNYEKFIEQAIESVLQQSFCDFELLIIDDGSTDNSKLIIDRYKLKENVTIIYQENKGLNITNNVAMRASKGKYIMRLDADDFLEIDALKMMSEALEKSPDLGLVFPDYYYVDNYGNRTGEERRHNFNKEVSLFDQPAHGACTMIRLEFLKKLGGYNESFTCQDGYELWIKFISHYKVSNINIPLFSYRRHGDNLTGDETRILSTRQKIKDTFVEDNNKTLDTLAIIPLRNTYINGENLLMVKINGKSIIESKIEECLRSKRIKHIVVTSSEKEVLDICRDKYITYDKISFIKRSKLFEKQNETLKNTITNAIQSVEKEKQWVEAIVTTSIEYPFLQSETIDEAINSLILFKADSVISVRPDNSMYYRHTGAGMTPILDQDKFTKLERDALYKGAGGVMVTTRNQFDKNQRSISGKVAHVVVDNKTAFGIFNSFDYNLFKLYLSKNI